MKPLAEEEKTPMRISHSLTVASANIFLLMKKESNYLLLLKHFLHHVYIIIFFFSFDLGALMLRVDSLAADQQPDKTVVSIEGLKGLFIVPGAPFSCAKSFEIKVISICNTFFRFNS